MSAITDLARSAADLHLNPGGHLYVGAASSDPVTHLGGLPQTPVPGTGWSVALGTDPALDGYGSTRFKAEVPGLTSPIGDHSQYYTPRSESLYSMAEIATGNGDALHKDGVSVLVYGQGPGQHGSLMDIRGECRDVTSTKETSGDSEQIDLGR